MSTKSNILTNIVAPMSNGQADPTAAGTFFDEIIRDMGRDGWMTTARLVQLTSGSQVVLPDDLITIDFYLYGDYQLGEVGIQQARWLYDDWRNVYGEPVSFVTEGESTKTIRLLPYPLDPSKPFSFIHGEPLGLDLPEYTLCILATEYRSVVPDYLDWPIALRVLAREYLRQSDHQDLNMSDACDEVAMLMLGMLAHAFQVI